MISNNEPYLIEYNVRMGDPECQTILPKLKTDLIDIINACCEGKLEHTNIQWHNKKSLCVVLCSKGYPEKFEKNVEIENINKLKFDANNYLFHAGTKNENGKIFATAGRVLNFVSIPDDFNFARSKIMTNIKNLNWSGGFYRKDIGHRVIKL